MPPGSYLSANLEISAADVLDHLFPSAANFSMGAGIVAYGQGRQALKVGKDAFGFGYLRGPLSWSAASPPALPWSLGTVAAGYRPSATVRMGAAMVLGPGLPLVPCVLTLSSAGALTMVGRGALPGAQSAMVHWLDLSRCRWDVDVGSNLLGVGSVPSDGLFTGKHFEVPIEINDFEIPTAARVARLPDGRQYMMSNPRLNLGQGSGQVLWAGLFAAPVHRVLYVEVLDLGTSAAWCRIDVSTTGDVIYTTGPTGDSESGRAILMTGRSWPGKWAFAVQTGTGRSFGGQFSGSPFNEAFRIESAKTLATLQNAWAAYEPAETLWVRPYYYKDGFGQVHAGGLMTNPAASGALFTNSISLPPGVAPPAAFGFSDWLLAASSAGGGSSGRFMSLGADDFNPVPMVFDGANTVSGSDLSTAFISLDGLSYLPVP